MDNNIEGTEAIVIGGDGFIGKVISKKLSNLGIKLKIFSYKEDIEYNGYTSYRLDIRNRDEVFDLIRDANYLFHFGGVLGTSELNFMTYDAVSANVLGTINILDAALQNNVSTIIYPAKPNIWFNAYTISKKSSYDFLKLYSKLHSQDIRIILLRNVYGPGQSLYSVRKLVPHIMECACKDKPIEVFGSGEQPVDLIHVEDTADLTIALGTCCRSKIMNDMPIETGRTIRVNILELIEIIERVIDKKLEVKVEPMRIGESEDEKLPLPPTFSNLCRYLGLSCQPIDLEKGLRDTYEYYQKILSQPN